jgi:DNA-binding transcriptional regulator YiaG
MNDTLKPPAKCSGQHRDQTDDIIDLDDEATRLEFIRFRNLLGWTKLRTAVELGYSFSAVKKWESAKERVTIPATAFNKLRRVAQQKTSCDSQGKIRVTA